jgi:glycine/D-amino acid oxidase-like deaminating enzyme
VNLEEGNPHVIITEKGNKIYAKYVIIASHYPFYDGSGMYFTRMHAEKSYIIAAKIKEKFPEGMFVTVEDPSRSMRCQEYKGGEVVLFAGEKHKTGHGENLLKHYENLESFAKDTFTLESILYLWSTQDYTTLDDIPYAGNLTSGTKNIYVASGFRKWGMTNATSSSLLIKDLILKGKSPWEEVYNPSRTNIAASAPAFIARNTDTAVTLISGKLAPAQQEASLDTTCSHMGCELKWNDAEKSWDCPCHGSRFDEEGKVIEGPAIKNLEKC